MKSTTTDDLYAFLDGDKPQTQNTAPVEGEAQPQPQSNGLQAGLENANQTLSSGNNVMSQLNEFAKNINQIINSPLAKQFMGGAERKQQRMEQSNQNDPRDDFYDYPPRREGKKKDKPKEKVEGEEQSQDANENKSGETPSMKTRRSSASSVDTAEQLYKFLVKWLQGIDAHKEDATVQDLLAELETEQGAKKMIDAYEQLMDKIETTQQQAKQDQEPEQ
jgi:hypothetical protein